MGKINSFVRSFKEGYIQYIEHHGLGLIIAACVTVVVGSAVWTYSSMPVKAEEPAFPESEVRSAAELLQESLAEAVKPIDAPEEQQEPVFHPPVQSPVISAPFDAVRLQQSPVTDLWQVHDAIDLELKDGEQVFSMADGTVVSISSDTLHGTSVLIDHGNGVTAHYMGLKAAAGLQSGDPVSGGQTIGFGGCGMADEVQDAHLHLRVTINEQATDPQQLWENGTK